MGGDSSQHKKWIIWQIARRAAGVRWCAHLCTPSLLINVHVGQIAHYDLVTPLPAVGHHCVMTRHHDIHNGQVNNKKNNNNDEVLIDQHKASSPAMRLLMVPDGTNRAASIWNMSAAICCNSAGEISLEFDKTTKGFRNWKKCDNDCRLLCFVSDKWHVHPLKQ